MTKYVKLGEVSNVFTGFPFKGELYEEEGIKVLRGENVTIGEIRWDVIKCWNGEYENLRKYELKAGDIVIGMDGSRVGKNRAKVKEEDLPLLLAQRVACLRSNDLIDQDYMYYLIFNPMFESYVNAIQTGSTVPHISQKQIEEYKIPLLPIKQQKKISNIFVKLDKKIELNNKINQQLEILAKTIFDYWFLQFEFPNDEGKPYKSASGRMIWNEELKRDIPVGWEVNQIGKYFQSNRGLSYDSNAIEGEGVPMINLASFNVDGSYKHGGLKTFSGNYSKEKVLKPYDLVMCNTQQTAIDFSKDIIGKAFLVPDIFDGDIVSSHHVTTVKVVNDELKFYFHRLFNTDYFHRYAAGYANGTNILGLTFSGIEKHVTVIPDTKILKKFAKIMIDIEKRKSNILKENQELTQLRDWLLPLLINGQVGFKEPT